MSGIANIVIEEHAKHLGREGCTMVALIFLLLQCILLSLFTSTPEESNRNLQQSEYAKCGDDLTTFLCLLQEGRK